MGCFDFTYADNGENVRGRRGYVYISKALQKATGLANPMRFTSTDEYGRFAFDIKGRSIELDIYAIYAAQLALAGITHESKPIRQYIEELHKKTFADYRTEELEELIRDKGIHEFFSTNHNMPAVKLTVKHLANQREKTIDCEEYTDTRHADERRRPRQGHVPRHEDPSQSHRTDVLLRLVHAQALFPAHLRRQLGPPLRTTLRQHDGPQTQRAVQVPT